MNTPYLTVPHQEDSVNMLKSSKRKNSNPPPKCKRLKLLKTPPKERKPDPMPSSSKEPNSCEANFSKYDFKCSKFCFKKCQCDIRLSQDFAPVGGSGSQELREPGTSQCQVVSHSDSDGLSISIDSSSMCDNVTAKNPTYQELDLFDEAVALSGSVPLSGIGVSVFCNETDNTQCVIDEERESPEAENLYGDLDIDDNSTKCAGKMNVECTEIHKHDFKCRTRAGLIQHRGLEGLAIVSTGAMSLTSHLVDIMPHWNKLRKFAVIHTGRLNVIKYSLFAKSNISAEYLNYILTR